jgi:glutaryl-CoA dehydrogenase
MLDYVSLEADLDEEERMIRDTAREFVEDEVKPDIADHFEAGTFPTDLISEMGELGFYAPCTLAIDRMPESPASSSCISRP